MPSIRSWATFVIAIALAVCEARAEEPAEPAEPAATATTVSYFHDIRPLFQENCQGCHQPAKAQGGLSMTSTEEMLAGGESEEPIYVAGDPDDSLLMLLIASDGDTPPSMPKGRDPLSADQVDLVRRWIAEGAIDDSPQTARDTISMNNPPVYESSPVVTSLSFSPDGSLLAVSGYHEVVLHQADGSAVVARLVGLAERIESVRFSPDGKHLAVVGGSPGRFGELQIWDVEKRTLAQALTFTYDTITGASWSPDGTKIAFGCTDNTLRSVEAATGKQLLYQGAHTDWVLDTAFSTDASHVVSVSRDGSMKLTEFATERFVDNITSITPGALKGGLQSVERHPTQDHLLTGGADGVPKIYQMYRTQDRRIGDDFNLIRAFDGMPGRIFAVAFNHDGSLIAAGSSADGQGEIRVYQTEDGKQLARVGDGLGPIYAVDFRPDGTQIASGGFDGVVRLHDAKTGEQIKEFLAVPLAGEVVAAVTE